MDNPLDKFGKTVCKKRKECGLTQRELAEKLGMSHRTIMQAETCKSNPKLETAFLMAAYLNFSLDAMVPYTLESPAALPKCVVDYFGGMSAAKAEELIELCKKAEKVNDNR